jgi:two-component system NarL family response regulator
MLAPLQNNHPNSMSEAPSSTLRVLIADDHPLMREGIAALLSGQDGIDVVAMAGDGFEAVALFDQHRPDLWLVDLQMPGSDGVAAIVAIRRLAPTARIIVLTTFGGDARVAAALRAGAAAYLLKDVLGTDLVATVRAVCAGQQVIAPALKRALAAHAISDTLSARELEVLGLAAGGRSNREIGAVLTIGEATVKTHMSTILAKLGASDRTHAVALAVQRGYITL